MRGWAACFTLLVSTPKSEYLAPGFSPMIFTIPSAIHSASSSGVSSAATPTYPGTPLVALISSRPKGAAMLLATATTASQLLLFPLSEISSDLYSSENRSN